MSSLNIIIFLGPAINNAPKARAIAMKIKFIWWITEKKNITYFNLMIKLFAYKFPKGKKWGEERDYRGERKLVPPCEIPQEYLDLIGIRNKSPGSYLQQYLPITKDVSLRRPREKNHHEKCWKSVDVIEED